MRKVLVIEKHVAISTWFLATGGGGGGDYQRIGHLFGVAKSQQCVCVCYEGGL